MKSPPPPPKLYNDGARRVSPPWGEFPKLRYHYGEKPSPWSPAAYLGPEMEPREGPSQIILIAIQECKEDDLLSIPVFVHTELYES